jgi:rhodanese-related sulfurtransferase
MRSKRWVPWAAVALLLACAPLDNPEIAADELDRRIAAGEAPLVLDVRSRVEYERGHIPGALNIPHDELSKRLGELPEDKSAEIVVHCQSGRRARAAETELSEAGYTNLRDLIGHWQGWQADARPSE